MARENVMIKIPGTPEGIPAIRQTLSEGININITLLFAQDVYEEVAQTYVSASKHSPPAAEMSAASPASPVSLSAASIR